MLDAGLREDGNLPGVSGDAYRSGADYSLVAAIWRACRSWFDISEVSFSRPATAGRKALRSARIDAPQSRRHQVRFAEAILDETVEQLRAGKHLVRLVAAVAVPNSRRCVATIRD